MTEHHPTYFESRNVYQRLADVLPLVDKFCFVAEHGEVVNLGRVVRDALSEMFRLREMDTGADKKAHVVAPTEPSSEDLIWKIARAINDRTTFVRWDDATPGYQAGYKVEATAALCAIENVCGNITGVLSGSHVIVPKEPTQKMLDFVSAQKATKEVNGLLAFATTYGLEMAPEYKMPGNTPFHLWYRAMIEAAQEHS